MRGAGAAMEQRESALGQPPRAERVDLEHLVRPVEVVVRRPDRISVHARVVDEYVEVSRIGPISSRAAWTSSWSVTSSSMGMIPSASSTSSGSLSAGEDDKVVIGGELAGDLAADPAARAADQRHPSIRSHLLGLEAAEAG